MGQDTKISATNKLLREFSEVNMKASVSMCNWCFYQPKVPQKILDRYKK